MIVCCTLLSWWFCLHRASSSLSSPDHNYTPSLENSGFLKIPAFSSFSMVRTMNFLVVRSSFHLQSFFHSSPSPSSLSSSPFRLHFVSIRHHFVSHLHFVSNRLHLDSSRVQGKLAPNKDDSWGQFKRVIHEDDPKGRLIRAIHKDDLWWRSNKGDS